jgi:transcriptional regulator with XRE-family HTH domain
MRVAQNLTQQELATRLGVARNTVAMYESGCREPGPALLQRMAEVLSTSTDYLLGCTPCHEEKPVEAHKSGNAPAVREIMKILAQLDARGQSDVLQFARFRLFQEQGAAGSERPSV